MLLSGVVTLPPRATEEPLIEIDELINELLGIFEKKFVLPDSVQDSNVLFVIVWEASR